MYAYMIVLCFSFILVGCLAEKERHDPNKIFIEMMQQKTIQETFNSWNGGQCKVNKEPVQQQKELSCTELLQQVNLKCSDFYAPVKQKEVLPSRYELVDDYDLG